MKSETKNPAKPVQTIKNLPVKKTGGIKGGRAAEQEKKRLAP
jgi:hypothetical protein